MRLSDFRQFVPDYELNGQNVMITNYRGMMSETVPIQLNKDVRVRVGDETMLYNVQDAREDAVVSSSVNHGAPVLVVQDELYDTLLEKTGEQNVMTQTSVNLVDDVDLQQAEKLYDAHGNREIVLDYSDEGEPLVGTLQSFEEMRQKYMQVFGLTIFITAFLGLAFLLSTGSILYFKQMTEAEEENIAYIVYQSKGQVVTDLEEQGDTLKVKLHVTKEEDASEQHVYKLTLDDNHEIIDVLINGESTAFDNVTGL